MQVLSLSRPQAAADGGGSCGSTGSGSGCGGSCHGEDGGGGSGKTRAGAGGSEEDEEKIDEAQFPRVPLNSTRERPPCFLMPPTHRHCWTGFTPSSRPHLQNVFLVLLIPFAVFTHGRPSSTSYPPSLPPSSYPLDFFSLPDHRGWSTPKGERPSSVILARFCDHVPLSCPPRRLEYERKRIFP